MQHMYCSHSPAMNVVPTLSTHLASCRATDTPRRFKSLTTFARRPWKEMNDEITWAASYEILHQLLAPQRRTQPALGAPANSIHQLCHSSISAHILFSFGSPDSFQVVAKYGDISDGFCYMASSQVFVRVANNSKQYPEHSQSTRAASVPCLRGTTDHGLPLIFHLQQALFMKSTLSHRPSIQH
jgi:hypothetical protein